MRSIIEPPPLQSQPRINKACKVRVAKLPAGQGVNPVRGGAMADGKPE
jgi:hypothetical protein